MSAADGRSASQRAERHSEPRSMPEPLAADRRGDSEKPEPRCAPSKPALVTCRHSPSDQAAWPPSLLVTPSTGGGLGLAGQRLELLGGERGGVIEVEVGDGALGQPVLGGQADIGVLGGQPGHGHGALDQPGASCGRDVGAGHDGLAGAHEHPQAEVPRLLALDLLQFAQPHADRQRTPLGPHRLGGVGAGLERVAHEILQQLGVHGLLRPGSRPELFPAFEGKSSRFL